MKTYKELLEGPKTKELEKLFQNIDKHLNKLDMFFIKNKSSADDKKQLRAIYSKFLKLKDEVDFVELN